MSVPEDIQFLKTGSEKTVLDAASLYRHMLRCGWSCSYCALLEDDLNEQGVDAREYQEELGRSTYRARFQELWGALRYRRYRERMKRAVITAQTRVRPQGMCSNRPQGKRVSPVPIS